MTIEELKMVNKISSYINAHTEMDFRTAYSFALAVVQNKEYLKEVLNEGSENECVKPTR